MKTLPPDQPPSLAAFRRQGCRRSQRRSIFRLGAYTRALAMSDQVVWAGGQAGVISIELTSGISVAQTLPWSNSLVRALAIAPNEHVWAAMTEGLAEFDPGTHTWYSHTAPFSGVVRTLASDTAGAIWAGGGDGVHEYLAVYTGTWTIARTFSTPVTALTVDGENQVWVGTWDDGVYRKAGNAWTHYQDTDGLASNYVRAAAADAHAVWFGTEPYSSSNRRHGGIARYDLTTGAWRTYTTFGASLTKHGTRLCCRVPDHQQQGASRDYRGFYHQPVFSSR